MTNTTNFTYFDENEPWLFEHVDYFSDELESACIRRPGISLCGGGWVYFKHLPHSTDIISIVIDVASRVTHYSLLTAEAFEELKDSAYEVRDDYAYHCALADKASELAYFEMTSEDEEDVRLERYRREYL